MKRIVLVVLACMLALPTAPVQAGSCDCPWQRDSAGRLCGKRAASEKPGGANPSCDLGPGGAAEAPQDVRAATAAQPPAWSAPAQTYRQAVPLTINQFGWTDVQRGSGAGS